MFEKLHVSCWAGGCCNIVVRFGSFVCFKSLLCSHEDYKTVPWAQTWGRPPSKERNAATNPTHREAPPFAGALVILCTPCSFCFAWGGVKKKKQQKVLFSYIFTSTPFDSSPQPEKKEERSSVYMLKLHLFYSQLATKNKQNNKKNVKLEGKCQQETRNTVGVCAHHELGGVFPVNHTIWDGCTRCRPQFYQV